MWAGDPILRAVLAAVVVTAVATIAGVVALWPTGEGRRTAIANADEIGLVTDRLSATVEEVLDRRCSYSTEEDPQDCRTVTLIVHEGPEAGAIVVLPETNLRFDRSMPNLAVGDQVVLGYEDSTNFYFYADQDRRTSLLWLAGLFGVVVIALGRFRGVLALLAMAATLLVLVAFVAPSALDGNDPLLVAVVAASAIAFISLYMTHGFTPTTTVALAGTLAALGLTLGLSWMFFELAEFTGLATEEALILPFIAENLDVSALLLGGAVIGALGALDDVTVTQVATVAELRRHSPHLPTTELVASGIRVGRDHIASTVNTLLLAYAGASMPLILLFAVSDQPLDMVANSELIAVEIVRTLCGSIGLVAAVPITTALAAVVLRPLIAGDGAPPDGFAQSADPSPGPRTAQAVEEASEPPPRREPRWEDFGPTGDE
ncbi:MAG: YibE/F family protein [Actinomycetia bacterium]|nr:YibE/F family protein [Actinomycetes bacterium]MCP4085442.1 YibE/F family protein [Actinomycetes bacterium]